MIRALSSILAMLLLWASCASAAIEGAAAQSPQSLPESVSAQTPSVPASPPAVSAPAPPTVFDRGRVGPGTRRPTSTLTVAGSIGRMTGNLALPAFAGDSVGILTLGGRSFLRAFGGVTHTFGGEQTGGTISAMTLALPATTGSTVGVLTLGGPEKAFLHAFGGGTNTFVGLWAGGAFATTGTYNAAFGFESLRANTTGGGNAAFGTTSLRANTTGAYNAAFGHQSLMRNTTGSTNAAFGTSSLMTNTTGTYNAAFGMNAGGNNTSGDNNTYVGSHAGPDWAHSDLQYSAAVGAWAVVTQSKSLVLGGVHGSESEVQVGIGTSAPNTTLQVVGDIRVGTAGTNGCLKNFAGTGIIGNCASDARLKTNIRPFGSVLDRVVRLQPVRFNWKAEQFPDYHFGEGLNSGLIAQDVEQVFPDMVATDERGYKMVNYSELPYLTLAAVRELDAKAAALQAENDALRTQLAALTGQVAVLTEAVAAIRDRRQ